LEAWRQHDALGTRDGQILTDVAEMDDLSGVALSSASNDTFQREMVELKIRQ